MHTHARTHTFSASFVPNWKLQICFQLQGLTQMDPNERTRYQHVKDATKREETWSEHLTSWSLRSFRTCPSLSLLHHKVALLVNFLTVRTHRGLLRDANLLEWNGRRSVDTATSHLPHQCNITPFLTDWAFPKPSGWSPPAQRAQLPPWKRSATVCYMTGNDGGYQIWLWCIPSFLLKLISESNRQLWRQTKHTARHNGIQRAD